ncbi:MAG: DNA-directed RNA polymerase subunit beta [Dehalococcoidia bacterium]|nr:DNA-directed RNA polymerase subunit beta [Dehalococcoidia bacterium]
MSVPTLRGPSHPGNGAGNGSTKSYGRTAEVLAVPNLLRLQLDSYEWFRSEGLRELLDEISPIVDFTGSKMELRFGEFEFRAPKYSEQECREREMTFAAPLFVKAQLEIRQGEGRGEIRETELFFGDFPLMTRNGTFVVNGAERVVVSQLVRSPGAYFTVEEDATTGRELCYAKLIPNRGAWLEFETSNKNVIYVKVDRKRRIPFTTLLRAVGFGADEDLLELFKKVDPEFTYVRPTMERDIEVTDTPQALIEFYRRLRPGDPPTVDNARSLVKSLFFDFRRYDLGRVGRYKLNRRLGHPDLETITREQRVLSSQDLAEIGRHIILVNQGKEPEDDIDHLGNRRVRSVGELIQNQFRIGLLRMERMVKERMTIVDTETATPGTLINIRPVVAAMKEFFGGSQLSQFMDQTNPLAELTHKRRLSALGPGGLSRERAGFDVRDVHHSHYGRICPIETPEGPNIGLIGSLATYAVVNKFGFIETPYRVVKRELPNRDPDLVGRALREPVKDGRGRVVAPAGQVIDAALAKKLAALPEGPVPVALFVTEQIEYLSADREERHIIAQANTALDAKGQFIPTKVEARHGRRFVEESPERMEYMDVSPKQIVSVATSLIPFLEHDDANRALMGSNMQRQAVPLLRPETPLIGTGMEPRTAMDSGQVIYAEKAGIVTLMNGREAVVQEDGGSERRYPLMKFVRSNQGTCINQRSLVSRGDRVQTGQPLADSSSTDHGQLALGQNVLVAFMSWEGYNFEDAIVISENLVREDKFTSIHIEKHEVEARDTKLGPEEITRDIPNVGEESLRDLDESGIISIGAEVGPGDILVGKITPKGETELTAEEKLLRAIFGEKAREVKDTSLRVPHGERGKVIDVKVFTREKNDELPPGVNQLVRVWVAQKRKISEGDKMAGRHGNKGVIARILPAEDMPYLEDGTPVEIILNPIGVPSRMNLGQILETHLGWAAQVLGFTATTPVFDGPDVETIEDALARAWIVRTSGALTIATDAASGPQATADLGRARAWVVEQGYDGQAVFSERKPHYASRVATELWLKQEGVEPAGKEWPALQAEVKRVYNETRRVPPTFGKTTLYDGRTGEPFEQPVTTGYIYMLKLIHLVEDKIHARSTGPYSLITQQPLGGKAQFGGQRFGEMEVWALEAYGAAHVLQELLTVKSDDVVGRVKTYEAIVKGENIQEPGVPESFKVLVKELQSLGLAVEVLNDEEERVPFLEETSTDVPELGINLAGFETRISELGGEGTERPGI